MAKMDVFIGLLLLAAGVCIAHAEPGAYAESPEGVCKFLVTVLKNTDAADAADKIRLRKIRQHLDNFSKTRTNYTYVRTPFQEYVEKNLPEMNEEMYLPELYSIVSSYMSSFSEATAITGTDIERKYTKIQEHGGDLINMLKTKHHPTSQLVSLLDSNFLREDHLKYFYNKFLLFDIKDGLKKMDSLKSMLKAMKKGVESHPFDTLLAVLSMQNIFQQIKTASQDKQKALNKYVTCDNFLVEDFSTKHNPMLFGQLAETMSCSKEPVKEADDEADDEEKSRQEVKAIQGHLRNTIYHQVVMNENRLPPTWVDFQTYFKSVQDELKSLQKSKQDTSDRQRKHRILLYALRELVPAKTDFLAKNEFRLQYAKSLRVIDPDVTTARDNYSRILPAYFSARDAYFSARDAAFEAVEAKLEAKLKAKAAPEDVDAKAAFEDAQANLDARIKADDEAEANLEARIKDIENIFEALLVAIKASAIAIDKERVEAAISAFHSNPYRDMASMLSGDILYEKAKQRKNKGEQNLFELVNKILDDADSQQSLIPYLDENAKEAYEFLRVLRSNIAIVQTDELTEETVAQDSFEAQDLLEPIRKMADGIEIAPDLKNELKRFLLYRPIDLKNELKNLLKRAKNIKDEDIVLKSSFNPYIASLMSMEDMLKFIDRAEKKIANAKNDGDRAAVLEELSNTDVQKSAKLSVLYKIANAKNDDDRAAVFEELKNFETKHFSYQDLSDLYALFGSNGSAAKVAGLERMKQRKGLTKDNVVRSISFVMEKAVREFFDGVSKKFALLPALEGELKSKNEELSAALEELKGATNAYNEIHAEAHVEAALEEHIDATKELKDATNAYEAASNAYTEETKELKAAANAYTAALNAFAAASKNYKDAVYTATQQALKDAYELNDKETDEKQKEMNEKQISILTKMNVRTHDTDDILGTKQLQNRTDEKQKEFDELLQKYTAFNDLLIKDKATLAENLKSKNDGIEELLQEYKEELAEKLSAVDSTYENEAFMRVIKEFDIGSNPSGASVKAPGTLVLSVSEISKMNEKLSYMAVQTLWPQFTNTPGRQWGGMFSKMHHT